MEPGQIEIVECCHRAAQAINGESGQVCALHGKRNEIRHCEDLVNKCAIAHVVIGQLLLVLAKQTIDFRDLVLLGRDQLACTEQVMRNVV